MQISSATSSSPGAIKGNKAALERKIKQLEKKRDKLQRKLAGFGDSESNDSGGGIARGNVTVGGQTIASPAPAGKMMVMGSGATAAPAQTSVSDSVSTQVGVMNQATGKAAPVAVETVQAPAAYDEAASIGASLQSMSQSIASSGGGGGGDMTEEDRELIQKQIESLNMLIVTLRSQLARMEDDGSAELKTLEEPEEEGGGATGPAEAIPIASSEPLPEVEVSAEGHVDGYA